MFGISLWKIAAAVMAVLAVVGYFKYTQDKIADLNKEVATKAFALKAANETIAQQQADMKRQQETLSKLNTEFQDARSKVGELESKFNKGNRDFGALANEKPSEIEMKVNRATNRVLKCIEDVVNKGAGNGC